MGDPPFLSDDPMQIYQQILTGKVKYTRSYDKYAKSLTKRILTADLTKRYGCLKNGASDIKTHKWFVDFDFDSLLARKLEAPIVPVLSGNDDLSNFDEYDSDTDDALAPEYEDGEDPFLDFF